MGLTACASSPTVRVTDEEEREYIEREKVLLAEELKIENPPEVDVVRFVDWDEVQQVLDECLAKAGFPNGGPSPDGQEELQALAEYRCSLEYPIKFQYLQDGGDAEAERAYRYVSDYLVPCLTANGHRISGAPSLKTYQEAWRSGQPYTPYSQVGADSVTDQTAYTQLSYNCPQTPPGSIVWGEESVQEWIDRTGRGDFTDQKYRAAEVGG